VVLCEGGLTMPRAQNGSLSPVPYSAFSVFGAVLVAARCRFLPQSAAPRA